MKNKKFLRRVLSLFLLTIFSLATFVGCTPSNTPPVGNGDGNGNGTGGVDEYVVDELTVITPPNKTSYIVGETFDYSGMRLKAVWNDGEVEEIGAYECDEIKPKGALTADVTQMTFVYYGKEITYPITVLDLSVTTLTVDTSNVKTKVPEGTFIDLTGLVVKATYAGADAGETVTQYTLTENGTEIETPARYQVTKGDHTITVGYLGATKDIIITGFSGKTHTFTRYSINSTLSGANSETTSYVEPANTVKNYKKVNGVWEETTSVSYSVSDNEGITDIKPFAEIKIHFYSEVSSYANISINAASYLLTAPHNGNTAPMQFSKLFSSVKLNGTEVELHDSTLPASILWGRTFVDASVCSDFVVKGDNVLTLVTSDEYWLVRFATSQSAGYQCYNESEISIRSLTIEHVSPERRFVSISATAPNKSQYNVGETFDPTGMVVTANYTAEPYTEVITDYTYSTEALKAEDNGKFTVSYQGKTAIVPMEVNHELVAGWEGSAKPSANRTTSFFLNKDGVAGMGTWSMGQYYSSSFKAGAKMRFYFYSATASRATLSVRVASGQPLSLYKYIGINLYKLSTVMDDISTLTPTNVSIDTSITFGYNDGLEGVLEWTDFTNKIRVGDIELQAGWNVIEVYIPQTKQYDLNFKSVVLNYKD